MEWPGWDVLFEVLTLQRYNTRLVVISTALLGIAAGVVGSFLLLRKRSLMGDALSHATLPGIALLFLVMVLAGGSGKALSGLLVGATLTGIGGMVLVLAIRNTTRLHDDAAMGIILSVFFGIGTVLLGFIQGMPQGSAAGLETFIYGKTASMVFTDVQLIAGAAILVSVCCLALFKECTLLCFDEDFAASQGWPVRRLDLGLLAMVTVVTVVGLQAVGLILIIAFLITPPAAARFWTHDLRNMLLIGGFIGGLSGYLGASISALLPNLPAGALIVLIAAALFMVSILFGPAGGILQRWLEYRQLVRKVGRQHLLRSVYEILELETPLERDPVNCPVSKSSLAGHRVWSGRELERAISEARRSQLIESAGAPEGSLLLSEIGFAAAARTTRNHRLWEIYLITYADIAPAHVDRDADAIEHILDPELVRKLEERLATGRDQRVPPSPHLLASSRPEATA